MRGPWLDPWSALRSAADHEPVRLLLSGVLVGIIGALAS
jgi:hypothetical protein